MPQTLQGSIFDTEWNVTQRTCGYQSEDAVNSCSTARLLTLKQFPVAAWRTSLRVTYTLVTSRAVAFKVLCNCSDCNFCFHQHAKLALRHRLQLSSIDEQADCQNIQLLSTVSSLTVYSNHANRHTTQTCKMPEIKKKQT